MMIVVAVDSYQHHSEGSLRYMVLQRYGIWGHGISNYIEAPSALLRATRNHQHPQAALQHIPNDNAYGFAGSKRPLGIAGTYVGWFHTKGGAKPKIYIYILDHCCRDFQQVGP